MNNLTIRQLMEKFPNDLDTPLVMGFDGPYGPGAPEIEDIHLESDSINSAEYYYKKFGVSTVIYMGE